MAVGKELQGPDDTKGITKHETESSSLIIQAPNYTVF